LGRFFFLRNEVEVGCRQKKVSVFTSLCVYGFGVSVKIFSQGQSSNDPGSRFKDPVLAGMLSFRNIS
jgi:hypothetical protein